ncbi:Cmi8p SCDLUD_004917 [Saccharomycodes ludwigii]|uniref:Cmi8p n=1 Tax=Saccharomycodes ludwigii TaxID=36035 RepID=UPI001E89F034|nr:hypothetical protein SCDLUD_004917 [Saccharomycodes ludwigii]KAH3899473.1 hypothetical protein SCDLUD_004917 [Saccharomycodes ludwigii]
MLPEKTNYEEKDVKKDTSSFVTKSDTKNMPDSPPLYQDILKKDQFNLKNNTNSNSNVKNTGDTFVHYPHPGSNTNFPGGKTTTYYGKIKK